MNLESTVQRMLVPENRVIDYPALELIDEEELEQVAMEEHPGNEQGNLNETTCEVQNT